MEGWGGLSDGASSGEDRPGGPADPSRSVSAKGAHPSRGLVKADKHMPHRSYKGWTENPVYDAPECASDVVARTIDITPRQARKALVALVRAGYVIAPREPSNAMLDAYIRSYGAVSMRPSGIITGIGKARKRWSAMATQGVKIALSMKRSFGDGRDDDRDRDAAQRKAAGFEAEGQQGRRHRQNPITYKNGGVDE